MKTLGMVFLLIFTTTFTPAKALSNPKTTPEMTTKNHSEKMYIDPSKLYFSDEGIFLKICSDEWTQLDNICHDEQGYYLIESVLPSESTSNLREYDFDTDNRHNTNAHRSDEQEFYAYGEEIIEYGSRVSPLPKKWKCPYCNHWWEIGEKCQNKDCPTNQWKKEDKTKS